MLLYIGTYSWNLEVSPNASAGYTENLSQIRHSQVTLHDVAGWTLHQSCCILRRAGQILYMPAPGLLEDMVSLWHGVRGGGGGGGGGGTANLKTCVIANFCPARVPGDSLHCSGDAESEKVLHPQLVGMQQTSLHWRKRQTWRFCLAGRLLMLSSGELSCIASSLHTLPKMRDVAKYRDKNTFLNYCWV